MLLDLTTREAQELERALNVYLVEMDFEVARTDRREYRHDLMVDREALGEVRRRIEAMLARDGVGVAMH